MSLSDAMAYARQHQPSLRSAQARVDLAKRAASVVRAEWMPQVGATAPAFYGRVNNSTASFLAVRTLDLPRTGGSRADTTFSAAYPSTLVGIGVRQTIDDFGRLAALALSTLRAGRRDSSVRRRRGRGSGS